MVSHQMYSLWNAIMATNCDVSPARVTQAIIDVNSDEVT